MLLDEGTYYVQEDTLAFTAEDGGTPGSDVVWAAAPGKRATLSGATKLNLTWSEYKPGIWMASLPNGMDSFRALFVGDEPYRPARTPNANPRWQLYPDGYSFDCKWGDDMVAADGIPFTGGNLTDLCQQGNVVATKECNRDHTQFPDSPWYDGGWACRFEPCQACADYGDHNKCMHGQMESSLFKGSWKHPEVAAVLSLFYLFNLHCTLARPLDLKRF